MFEKGDKVFCVIKKRYFTVGNVGRRLYVRETPLIYELDGRAYGAGREVYSHLIPATKLHKILYIGE